MGVELPRAPEHAEWHARGWWRTETVLDDLRRAVAAVSDRPAVVGRYLDGAPADTLTWRELAAAVDRAAGGLVELGVRPGDILSVQLPNRWQLAVLALAAPRVGAAICPLMPIMRRREVAFALARTGSAVVVAPAVHRGFSHADMLAEVAAEVPTLWHRVLIGGAPADGVIDFDAHFLDTAWEDRHPAAELDALEAGADNLALLRHPAVRAVAVVGLPDERLGERACAVVVGDGPLTLEDLTAHLAGLGMAKPYWPERLELVPELPRTPSGKVQKFLLRARLSG